jgi:hypothetical protein
MPTNSRDHRDDSHQGGCLGMLIGLVVMFFIFMFIGWASIHHGREAIVFVWNLLRTSLI